jgi:hypothetical protein
MDTNGLGVVCVLWVEAEVVICVRLGGCPQNALLGITCQQLLPLPADRQALDHQEAFPYGPQLGC